ncbi:MAG: fluoride efflux transporter CrcB [Myxococcaceae bacterium]|nr:fluoride efflux transporter CrcB [Myxococcaceae bacterium]
MRNLGLVVAGGAFGSGARYLVAVFAEKALPASFFWGTFIVNVVGSALLGAIAAAATGEPARLSPELRLLLGTGVMGGFTTYSTFNAEVLKALQAGAHVKAGVYLLATVTVCLLGAWAGWAAVRA